MRFVMKKTLLSLIIASSLIACSSTKPKDETRQWPIERLYIEARDELNSENYTRAIQLYETLEARFPYGNYAQQAQLDLAYAHYRDREPALALAALDRFLKLYPTHRNLDYVYYLKGLIHYDDDVGIVAKLLGQQSAERDPKAAKEAFEAFKTLVERFPKSKYADDAVKKMEALVTSLAENELFIARYYMKQNAYVAANARAQKIVQNFPNSAHVEEALAIMMTAYSQLKLEDLRRDTERILQKNYPDSVYLKQGWQPKSLPWYQFW